MGIAAQCKGVTITFASSCNPLCLPYNCICELLQPTLFALQLRLRALTTHFVCLTIAFASSYNPLCLPYNCICGVLQSTLFALQSHLRSITIGCVAVAIPSLPHTCNKLPQASGSSACSTRLTKAKGASCSKVEQAQPCSNSKPMAWACSPSLSIPIHLG